MDNPFSLIVLAAQKARLTGKVPEEELGKERLTIARAFLESKKYSHERIMRFLYFLKNFIYIENPEINLNFDEEIDQLTGKQSAMGIIEAIKQITREEGIEKGIEKRNAEIVKNLIIKMGFSDDQVADVADVPIDFVKKIRKKLKK